LRLTVRSDNGSTPGESLAAMNEYVASRSKRSVDESTCGWEMYQEIGIVDIFDSNPHMAHPSFRKLGWDVIRADR